MTMAPSAPISAARFVCRIVCSVEFAPVPAMNVLSRGMASRAVTSTRSRSPSLSIGNSPVDPRTTYPDSLTAFQTRKLDASRSMATSSPLKGVGTGTKTPSKLGMGRPFRGRLARLDPGLRRAQPCDGDHERRARDVGHVHPVTELDGRRLAAVLAADADLEVGARATPALDADLDELAHTLLVEDREGIVRQQPLLEVVGQELRHVVAAVAERHLGEVVGAEGEELG